MAFYYTNYHFTKMVFSKLDLKYQEMFINDNDKIFLYSNMFNLIESFRFSKIKIKSYDITNKLNSKQDLLIKNLVTEVKVRNYDKTYVTFLFAIATSLVLDFELTKYGIIKSDELLIDYSYNEAHSDKYQLSKDKEFLTLNEDEINFISSSLKNTYYLPLLEKYIKISNKEFKNCFKLNMFRRIKQKFKDLTFYRKSNTKYRYSVYKKKYKKQHNLYIINDTYSISYHDILNEALNKALVFIDALNEFLYFDKHSKFIKVSESYNWHSFNEQKKYIQNAKKENEIRHKKYKLFRKNKNSNNN